MKRPRRTDRVVLVLHRPLPCFPSLVLCFALAVVPSVLGVVQPGPAARTQDGCAPDGVSRRLLVRLDEQAPRGLAGAQHLAVEIERC